MGEGLFWYKYTFLGSATQGTVIELDKVVNESMRYM